MPLAQQINASVQSNFTIIESLAYGAAAANVPTTLIPVYSFTNGNGTSAPNLADDFFVHTYTLAASASVTLTLSALTDDLGRAVAFAKVAALLIQTTTRTAGDYLTVGNAALHPWLAFLGGTTPTFRVYALDLQVVDNIDGFAVGADTSDQLLITNSGANSITFKVALFGRSV